jgi:hypothetical protein
MVDDSPVNSQITDSVSQVVTLLTGQAPSQAFGMLDAVLLETLGMAMYNAVNRQHNAHMTGSAAVTAACAKMLQAPYPVPLPPHSPPPSVQPLPGPPPSLPPAAALAAANAEALAAVDAMQRVSASGSNLASTAEADLAGVVQAASPKPSESPKPETGSDPR